MPGERRQRGLGAHPVRPGGGGPLTRLGQRGVVGVGGAVGKGGQAQALGQRHALGGQLGDLGAHLVGRGAQALQPFRRAEDLLGTGGLGEGRGHRVDQVVQVGGIVGVGADAHHVGVGHGAHIERAAQQLDVLALGQGRRAQVDAACLQVGHGAFQHVLPDDGVRQVVHELAVLRVRLQFQFLVGVQVLHVGGRHLEHGLAVEVALAADPCEGQAHQQHQHGHQPGGAWVALQAQPGLDAGTWQGADIHRGCGLGRLGGGHGAVTPAWPAAAARCVRTQPDRRPPA